MNLFCKIFSLVAVMISAVSSYAENEMVVGKHFSVPATQQIRFVPLRKIDLSLYKDSSIPRMINLRDIQSKVKSQGMRGACTYFVTTSLIESLIIKATGREVDLSEEYLAWAAKTKLKLRPLEEDSSVAVNAITIQESGFMYERDLPYQQSWFEPGFPCAGKKELVGVDPICYSHAGPTPEQIGLVRSGQFIEFHDIGSSSLDVVKAIAKWRAPTTVSILAHPRMWAATKENGDLFLDEKTKQACNLDPKSCSGHAALITGYNLEKRVFFFKNSWGEAWGDKGYGTIPFDYLDQMSDRRFLVGKVIKPIQF